MAVSETAAGLFGFAQRQLDRLVPPESRQRAYAQTTDFALARPLLFALLLSLLTSSLIPLLLFLSFAGSTVLVAAGAALLFALFWIGIALAVLVPTLFVACAAAVCVWAWAVASFVAARWALRVLQSIAGSGSGSGSSISSDGPAKPSSPALPSPSSWTKVASADDDEKKEESPASKPGFGYESVLGA